MIKADESAPVPTACELFCPRCGAPVFTITRRFADDADDITTRNRGHVTRGWYLPVLRGWWLSPCGCYVSGTEYVLQMRAFPWWMMFVPARWGVPQRAA